jgi:hypothetical protein
LRTLIATARGREQPVWIPICICPREPVEVIDVWRVGLRATGSDDYVVNEFFVQEEWTIADAWVCFPAAPAGDALRRAHDQYVRELHRNRCPRHCARRDRTGERACRRENADGIIIGPARK